MRAAIVLAAGRSRRFGVRNKLLALFRGKPLVRHAVEAALSVPVGRVIVVIGADSGRVARAVRTLGNSRIKIVRAHDYAKGRRASLRRGMAALRSAEGEALIFLGDVPAIPAGTGRRLVLRRNSGAVIRASHRGRPGHPVLIRDTKDARSRLERDMPPFERGQAVLVEAGRGVMLDIDRPGDLARPCK